MISEVRLARPEELPDCLALRHRIFVDEQGVPPELELDGRDDQAVHVLARTELGVVGTARLRSVDAEQMKVERVCVLPEARGRGVGRSLMDAAEALARTEGAKRVVLSAQRPVIAFYEVLGYRREGDIFLEAGIEHLRMAKPLVLRDEQSRA